MEHFYQQITGFFDFQQVYRSAVHNATDGAHFVEVGCYLGKSTAFMAVEIHNSGKLITFDCIDTFKGDDGTKAKHPKIHDEDDFYSQFLYNIKPVIGMVRPFPMRSVKASSNYPDASLDFVFIDGAHDWASVFSDIKSWLPKVKDGGVIGGHDYRSNCQGVWRAVGEIIGHDNVRKISNSWTYRIQ